MSYTDGCISQSEHHTILICGASHHCGPVFLEGRRTYCGECGRLVDVLPLPAQTAHTRYRNRFITACAENQSVLR